MRNPQPPPDLASQHHGRRFSTSKKFLLDAGVGPLCSEERNLLGELEPQVSESPLAVGLTEQSNK